MLKIKAFEKNLESFFELIDFYKILKLCIEFYKVYLYNFIISYWEIIRGLQMKDTDLTCGMVIKSAREEKGKTINDLAFEIAKDKEKVGEYEKKIKLWEKDKAYPSLDEIYLLAYSLEVNPTDLMILRDRHRKNFVKTDKKKKVSKIDYDELKEYLYYIAVALGRFVSAFGIIAFSVVLAKLVKTAVVGNGGTAEFDSIVGNVITDYMEDSNEANNAFENYLNENNLENVENTNDLDNNNATNVENIIKN